MTRTYSQKTTIWFSASWWSGNKFLFFVYSESRSTSKPCQIKQTFINEFPYMLFLPLLQFHGDIEHFSIRMIFLNECSIFSNILTLHNRELFKYSFLDRIVVYFIDFGSLYIASFFENCYRFVFTFNPFSQYAVGPSPNSFKLAHFSFKVLFSNFYYIPTNTCQK